MGGGGGGYYGGTAAASPPTLPTGYNGGAGGGGGAGYFNIANISSGSTSTGLGGPYTSPLPAAARRDSANSGDPACQGAGFGGAGNGSNSGNVGAIFLNYP
jgi:hypothetical protein